MSIESSKPRGAIVVAGGQSRRMGQPKAWLPFGPQTLLQRVLETLGHVADVLIVVAAKDQRLPDLPATTLVTFDERPGQGPLEGLRAGLALGTGRADMFYVSSCDVPLLCPSFPEFLFKRLDGAPDLDIVVPQDDNYFHPLAAVYRHRILPQVESLLAEGERRPRALFQAARTCAIPTETLRSIDPDLASLRNLNTPEDYQAALRDAFGSEPS